MALPGDTPPTRLHTRLRPGMALEHNPGLGEEDRTSKGRAMIFMILLLLALIGAAEEAPGDGQTEGVVVQVPDGTQLPDPRPEGLGV